MPLCSDLGCGTGVPVARALAVQFRDGRRWLGTQHRTGTAERAERHLSAGRHDAGGVPASVICRGHLQLRHHPRAARASTPHSCTALPAGCKLVVPIAHGRDGE